MSLTMYREAPLEAVLLSVFHVVVSFCCVCSMKPSRLVVWRGRVLYDKPVTRLCECLNVIFKSRRAGHAGHAVAGTLEKGDSPTFKSASTAEAKRPLTFD